MIIILYFILALLFFLSFQSIAYVRLNTTPAEEVRKKIDAAKSSETYKSITAVKQLELKKKGADFFLKEDITVSQWYTYKIMFALAAAFMSLMIAKGIMKSTIWPLIAVFFTVLGWFFLDFYLRMKSKSSNEAMLPDIVEMSRSILYGKRGGQYIGDALKSAIYVVENKRLKIALIKMGNDLDAGRPLEACLTEFDESFDNKEITAMCTVVLSLQKTGQVDEALKTLENNIEGQQASVNKRRSIVLENKTMIYVMLLCFVILILIIYCVVLRIMEIAYVF